MTETTTPLALPERARRLRFDWLLPALLHPRRVFSAIAEHPIDTWPTPLLLLTLTALLAVLVAGPLRREAALNAPPQLPLDFSSTTRPSSRPRFSRLSRPRPARPSPTSSSPPSVRSRVSGAAGL
ncbi:MAG: hypothetical protein AB1449_11260 [Chloroflexota bacterium]